jgi:hypothetical protein
MNKDVTEPTSRTPLPLYDVQELPVERRLHPGKHVVESNGAQASIDRRKSG